MLSPPVPFSTWIAIPSAPGTQDPPTLGMAKTPSPVQLKELPTGVKTGLGEGGDNPVTAVL